MSFPTGANETVLRLLSRMLDGEITLSQAEELAQLLRSYPAARREYIRWTSLHSHLESRSVPSPSWTSAAGQSLGAAAEPVPPRSPVLGFLSGVVGYVNRSRMLLFWLAAAMVSGWFVVLLASLIIGHFRAHDDQLADQADGARARRPGQTVNGSEIVSGKPVAKLGTAIDCHWGTGDASDPAAVVALQTGSELCGGQHVELTSGLVEIKFDSGARVILNGPVQFTVRSPLGGDLQLGDLSAKVPHQAAGFTVNTHAGSVVDLGTEFGVRVGADETMEVRVFVGAVSVTPSAGSGGGATVRLPAGQAVRAASGRPAAKIAAEQVRFIRDLDPYLDKPEAEAAYLALIRRLKPAVWFRMEGDGGRLIHDEMGNIGDASLTWPGDGEPFVNGRIGKALLLLGPKVKDYAIISDYPQAEHGKLSVAAWVLADSRPNFATIAKNYCDDGALGQFHFGLISPPSPQGDAGRPDGIDLAIQIAQANGQSLTVREGANHPFPVNAWQHVAFVADGTTLRLYRQGRQVASAKYAGLKFPVPLHALGIGVKPNEAGKTPDPKYPGYWSGKLDEIAIFNDALTGEDIRKLATAPPR